MDELFSLDPSEFVAARDALAAQLRADGETAAAKEVKALRRPSTAAWAVNQVARQHPELVVAVVAAGRELAAALGSGDRDALRRATAQRRETVTAATRAATALVGDQHRDDIADTFEAAASDDGAAASVTSGRLTRTLTPTAVFAPLGDVPVPPPPAAEPRVDDAALARARERAEAADAAVAAARHELTRAEQAAKAAWLEVEQLRR